MEKFAGNSLITHTDAATFSKEINKCINTMAAHGVSWDVQYRPLIGANGQLVYTALILYKTDIELKEEERRG